MRKISILLLVILIPSLSAAQTGSIAVNDGDVLTFQFYDVMDNVNPIMLLDQDVSSGDEFTIEVIDATPDANDIIDILTKFKTSSSYESLDVTSLDFITIPDWDFWSEFFLDYSVTFTVGDTVVLEDDFTQDGVRNYYRVEYNLNGIVLDYYDYYENDATQAVLLEYGYKLVNFEAGLVFDGDYEIERGQETKYVLSLYDTDLNIPFLASQTSELYLFEGDEFTVEVGSTPNANDEVLLRVSSGMESITYVSDMTAFLSFVIYTDFSIWVDIFSETQQDLESGEFLDYTLGDELEVNYVYNGADYAMYYVIYDLDGIMQYLEYEIQTSQGHLHFIVEIVKSTNEKKGYSPTIFLGLSALVILKRKRN